MCQDLQSYFVNNPVPELTANAYLVVIFGFFIAFGAFVIIVCCLKAGNLNPHLYLVISLCFADLIFGSEAIIFNLWLTKLSNPVYVCQIDAFFTQSAATQSIIMFGLITVERYLVICRNWQNHGRATIVAILMSAVLSITSGLLISHSPNTVEIAADIACHAKFCSRDSVILIVNLTMTIILITFLFLVVYCPYKIFALYGKVNSQGDSIKQAEKIVERQERNDKEKRLFVKLGVITGVFIAMVTPLATAILLEIITGESSSPFLANMYTFSLGLNSALNPILFYFLDPSVKVRIDSFFQENGLQKSKSSKFRTQIALNNLAIKDTVKL